MTIVKKFCYCCALPTGCLAIGLIQAGLNLLTILVLVITIAMSEIIKSYNESLVINSNSDSSNSNYDHVIGLYLTTTNFYIFISIKFIYLITSILLIVSVLTKKHKVLVLPYVVLEGLYLIIVLLLWIAIGFNISNWYTAKVFLIFGLYFVITMPVLKHCCCCASLAVGGVIIGWVNLIFSLLEIISAAISLSELDSIKDTVKDYDQESKEIVNIITTFGTIVLSVILAVKIICLIAAILLILGSTKRNRFHILPHLIIEAVYIFLLGIIWIIFFIAIFSESGLIAIFIVFTLICAFNLYLWLCVLSLYQEIREDESRPPVDSYLMRPSGPNPQIQHKPPAYATQQNLL